MGKNPFPCPRFQWGKKWGKLLKSYQILSNPILVVSTPLKNMKVSWDNYSQKKVIKFMFQTTNQ
jgi:hypothetical protein